MPKKICLILLACFGFSSPLKADFLETTWVVEKFTGEAWFLTPSDFVSQRQSFYRGYAEGVFYTCRYEGQSATYNRYSIENFFENPEFDDFKVLREEMSNGATTLYVHRITCANPEDSSSPKVLYPFITNDVRKQSWYLLEGGVFSLRQ